MQEGWTLCEAAQLWLRLVQRTWLPPFETWDALSAFRYIFHVWRGLSSGTFEFFCITNFVVSVALTCCCRSDLALSSSYCKMHSWTAIDLTSIGTQCFQHNLANILITLCFSVLHCIFGMITCLHFFADDSNRHINKYMNKMLRLSYFVKFSSSAPPALFTADILSHRRSFPGVTYHINNGSVVSKCASLS